jgi:hypothetical protein
MTSSQLSKSKAGGKLQFFAIALAMFASVAAIWGLIQDETTWLFSDIVFICSIAVALTVVDNLKGPRARGVIKAGPAAQQVRTKVLVDHIEKKTGI